VTFDFDTLRDREIERLTEAEAVGGLGSLAIVSGGEKKVAHSRVLFRTASFSSRSRT